MKIVVFKKTSGSILYLLPYPLLKENPKFWKWILKRKPIKLTIETIKGKSKHDD